MPGFAAVYPAVPDHRRARARKQHLVPRADLSDARRAVLHLDDDRLLRLDPKGLDEAALIDGASCPHILFQVFVPVAMPGIIAATIFAFTVSWGEFLYPIAYLYTRDQLVLTAGIVSELVRGDVFEWGKIMAASFMAAARR